MGPLRWVVSKKEGSWSKFVQVAVWLPLGQGILGLWGMSPGRCRLTMGPWTLWGYSWFISPSFDLHSPAGELRCLHQRALWIRNPRKLLNSLPLTPLLTFGTSRSVLDLNSLSQWQKLNCLPAWSNLKSSVGRTLTSQHHGQTSTAVIFKILKFSAHLFWAWRHPHSSFISNLGFIMTMLIVISFAHERKLYPMLCTWTLNPNSSKPNQTEW